MTIDDDLLYSMMSKSIYKQPFCHYVDKDNPNDYMYTEYEYLPKILCHTRKIFKDDIKFGKILFTYLTVPSYFSLIDYNILLEHFCEIDKKIQIIIYDKIFKHLIKNALENVVKYNYGIYNLYLLKERLPTISISINQKLDQELLYIIYERIDNFPDLEVIDQMRLELIISLYGSLDNFYNENMKNFIIEI